MRFRRILAGSVMLIATTMMFSVAEAKKPPAPTNTGSCPNTADLGTFKQASNVSASFSNSDTTTTYSFSSLTDEHPAKGVPGLIKYCVYPSPAEKPTAVTVSGDAVGDNGAHWVSNITTNSFSFARPGGNASDIGLRGQTIEMGTSTWDTLPKDQTILLHINDPEVCHGLYGADTPGTCFVLPLGGPICDAGDGDILAVYNVIPFGEINCGPPSWGFEARSTNELGQEVQLDHTGPLDTLKVAFNSYACSDSGHWNTGTTDPCQTTADTFDWPITANIYAVDTTSSGCTATPCKGALLATTTVTQTIPYRPSADPVKCPDNASTGIEADSQWYNPDGALNTGGGFGGSVPTPSSLPGDCEYSAKIVLSFAAWTFTSDYTGTLPNNVIWTVAFNTSDYGSTPQRPQNCNSEDQGCPYDSFNLGTLLYPNSPYAGLIPDPTAAWISVGNPAGALTRNTTAYGDGLMWTPYTPLGEIFTK